MLVAAVLVVLAFAAALGIGGVLLVRLLQRTLDGQRDEAGKQLAERSSEVDRRLEALDRRLADFGTTVDRRLESASRQTGEINTKLGALGKATELLGEQAKELGQLQHVLRPPKARGGFGELLLENLLRDRLPPSSYTLQHTFKTGERVDAVIRVDKLVPIDAKFTLDNFERIVAAGDEVETELHQKAFARDVKTHVDAIAAKYIRPSEDTYDFALMYLPAEAIYYELVSGKTGSLLLYAHEKRVFPVSATTFTAYLQVIAFGLKGLQIEQSAQEVLAYCAGLTKDFTKFNVEFDLVGTHLGRAYNKFADAEKRRDNFLSKLERASEQQPELASTEERPGLPRALDAA
jgi:DNA recombination protein RmuC